MMHKYIYVAWSCITIAKHYCPKNYKLLGLEIELCSNRKLALPKWLLDFLLNQKCTGHRPVCTGIFKLLCCFVYACVYVCVHGCVGVCTWVFPYDQLYKFHSFYMAAVLSIVSRCGLSIDENHRNNIIRVS